MEDTQPLAEIPEGKSIRAKKIMSDAANKHTVIKESIQANIHRWPEVSNTCRKCGTTVYIHIHPRYVESMKSTDNALCNRCNPESYWYTEEQRPGRSKNRTVQTNKQTNNGGVKWQSMTLRSS